MIRQATEINTGSMADIAFLLLIFFLITTTMDVDSGILRKLPEYDPHEPRIEYHKRDVLEIFVNSKDELMVEGEYTDIKNLKLKTKEFLSNPNNLPNLPEKKIENIEFFGDFPVSKQIISLKNDRGTSYKMYLQVQNELTAAYNELRNELSLKHFMMRFDALDEKKQQAILKIYPNHISEAEPKISFK